MTKVLPLFPLLFCAFTLLVCHGETVVKGSPLPKPVSPFKVVQLCTDSLDSIIYSRLRSTIQGLDHERRWEEMIRNIQPVEMRTMEESPSRELLIENAKRIVIKLKEVWYQDSQGLPQDYLTKLERFFEKVEHQFWKDVDSIAKRNGWPSVQRSEW